MGAVFQTVTQSFYDMNRYGYLTALLIIALLYLYRKKHEYGVFLLSYCAIAYVLCLNPLTADNLLSLFDDKADYWQIFLIVPAHLICALAMSCFIEEAKEKKQKLIRGLMIIMLLLFASPLFGAEKTDITDEYRECMNAIEFNTTTKILADDGLMTYIRAQDESANLLYEVPIIHSDFSGDYYDASLRMTYENMKEPCGKLGSIVKIARGNLCNYLIFPLDADERWEMEEGGYTVKAETEHYVVYYDESICYTILDDSH